MGHKAIIALREPSLGPVMGIKGGAAGEDILKWFQWKTLIFTLPGYACINCANNLLSAAIDNHIHQGNNLGIDPTQIIWKRAIGYE